MVLALTSLQAARIQMAVSLGFHIVFAALGVGLPLLLLVAEYRANRSSDATWMALGRRWAKALGILFAVGAVSGTVLSFALGLFWPGLMGRWGSVIGLPFALEAFAFFVEAIFLAIYLYGWDRLTPWKHWWSGVPIAVSGAARRGGSRRHAPRRNHRVRAWRRGPRSVPLPPVPDLQARTLMLRSDTERCLARSYTLSV
jgi:cytochrome bd-type quinol oxidase subunit 1